MIGTLWAALHMHSYVLSILFCAAQVRSPRHLPASCWLSIAQCQSMLCASIGQLGASASGAHLLYLGCMGNRQLHATMTSLIILQACISKPPVPTTAIQALSARPLPEPLALAYGLWHCADSAAVRAVCGPHVLCAVILPWRHAGRSLCAVYAHAGCHAMLCQQLAYVLAITGPAEYSGAYQRMTRKGFKGWDLRSWNIARQCCMICGPEALSSRPILNASKP